MAAAAPEGSGHVTGLRLTEVLTTASAVANYLGVPQVNASHMLSAVAILREEMTLDDLGRPQSPLVSRMTGAGSGAEPAARELAQRWFARFGKDVTREFSEAELDEFLGEVRALASAS